MTDVRAALAEIEARVHHLSKTPTPSLRRRLESLDRHQRRQTVLAAAYEQWTRDSDPRRRKRHGVVVTPVEVVDFMLRSVAHVVESEFGRTLGDPSMQPVLDPFGGTGIYLARLIELGLIERDALPEAYRTRLVMHEINPVACAVASANIRRSYIEATGERDAPAPLVRNVDTFAEPTD